MGDKNPLAYTGTINASTNRQGDAQFDSSQFSVTDGVVTLIGGGQAVDTVAGDSGTAVPTAAGLLTIAGGDNITTSATGSTVTASLNSAVSTGSVSSNTFTTLLSSHKLSLNGSTFTADGSSADVDFTFIPKGTGGIVLSTGNIKIEGAASQLQVEGGAVTDFIGEVTLAVGTATVLNTNIAATDRIYLTRNAINSSTALGHLLYTISAGASFTIAARTASTPGSGETGDLSTISYFIVRQL